MSNDMDWLKSEIERLENEVLMRDRYNAKVREILEGHKAALAALPPAPVRLIVGYDSGNYIDIGVANEPWVATVCKSRCAQHKIDPQALAAHIRAFSQPDPSAAALKAADALAEAVNKALNPLPHCVPGINNVRGALAAYRKAREVRV